MTYKTDLLKSFFVKNADVALGFSGGVDSSYLLYAGLKYGARVRPYFIKTQFQPKFELDDAMKMADLLGAELTVIDKDILANKTIAENPANRCYYCKTEIFNALRAQAIADGCGIIIDGTNVSDDAGDRPGMRAISELSVRSPLRECGFTKGEVRALSKEAGLFTWDKPAYACLATRIPFGTMITEELLDKTEKSENRLTELGFSNFRVRIQDDSTAKLQFTDEQIEIALYKREEIKVVLKKYFSNILLDLEVRQNE